MPSLAAGGGERSLVNLLAQIDYDAFEVDVFLLHPEGMFMDHLPPQVTILPLPELYQRFTLPLAPSVLALLAKGRLRLAFKRLQYAWINRTRRTVGEREQTGWKYMRESLTGLIRSYDAAIGFLEKTSVYLCVDIINASSKIGWIHNDYSKLETNAEFDRAYFEKLDHIVTVSDECAETLRTVFAEQEGKVNVIHNIVSPVVIRSLANQPQSDVYRRKPDEIVILTIGRLHPQKGLELAVEACRLLLNRGHSVQWIVIGEGDERANLTRLIQQYGLGANFKLLGLRSNPYPYIEQADIYAQTSRFEGKSIAIDEAKILNKPILVTNFSTARDQIRHEVDGLIVDMDPDSIAKGIARLIEDKELRNALSQALSVMNLGTEHEIEKLYRLLA